MDDRSDHDHTGDLSTQIYKELRALAAHFLQSERAGHTLQPTALVHEAWLRMAPRSDELQTEQDFRVLAARTMRRVLLDHARRRGAGKRGGDWLRVTLDEAETDDVDQHVDLIALDEAMTALSTLDERKARVVELRFFGGLTNAEAANVLDVSPKTTESDWYLARAWLLRQLGAAES